MVIICGPADNEKKVELSVPKNKKIGFLLSSGADSAILLYMTCLELLQEGRSPVEEIKYIFTIPKVDGAEDHSAKIVNWINKKLNLNLPAPTVDGPPGVETIPHGDIIIKSLLYFGAKYGLNYGFLADQRPVPEPYKVNGPYPRRTNTEENPIPDSIGLPFNHLDKSHTIDLHYKLDTLPLLELSHSCTQQRAGRCTLCYHCSERQWAFERLKRVDPGTN